MIQVLFIYIKRKSWIVSGFVQIFFVSHMGQNKKQRGQNYRAKEKGQSKYKTEIRQKFYDGFCKEKEKSDRLKGDVYVYMGKEAEVVHHS